MPECPLSRRPARRQPKSSAPGAATRPRPCSASLLANGTADACAQSSPLTLGKKIKIFFINFASIALFMNFKNIVASG
jgi:hypothetical protein